MPHMLSLLLGGGYHLFNPQVEGIPPDHKHYEVTVLKRMHKFSARFRSPTGTSATRTP